MMLLLHYFIKHITAAHIHMHVSYQLPHDCCTKMRILWIKCDLIAVLYCSTSVLAFISCQSWNYFGHK